MSVPPRPLTVTIAIDPRRARRWMLALRERLIADGHAVAWRLAENGPAPPAAVELLVRLERLVARRSGPHPAERIGRRAFEPEAGPRSPDLVIDLTEGPASAATARTLRLLHDGRPQSEAAAAALLERRLPTLAVEDSAAPGRPETARVAVEDPRLLTAALDMLAARGLTLLRRAVEVVAGGGVIAGEGAPPLRSAPAIGPGVLHAEAGALLARFLADAPHWFVGWRRCPWEDSLAMRRALPPGGWRRLPDDGRRFYADPFVVPDRSGAVVLVEEFPLATQKGVLSWFRLGPDGPDGAPRPFLETGAHLSYPMAFEHGGAWWMIPETSAARRIELYRAIDFPHRWEAVATLVDGVAAADATLVRHGGRLYLFASVADDGTSSWDALHVWEAERLLGPWAPLPGAPVLVDAGGARPAGHFWRDGDALYRPAQDCRDGYGAALAVARIDRLDREGCVQTVETVVRPGPSWPGIGLHTLNWGGGIEVVDGCRGRARRRIPFARRREVGT